VLPSRASLTSLRGKIELFGLDTLVNMIGAAGLHVEMRISDAA